MREIKFRAWNKAIKEMMHPEYMWWENHDFKDQEFSLKEISLWETAESYEKEGMLFSPESIELMQYTGLKDKNGTDIYEGDIVRSDFGVGYESKMYPSFANGTQRITVHVIEYEAPQFRYLHEPNDSNFEIKFEVIGNIYENPELLKEVPNA